MHSVFLGLGSNLGNREKALKMAQEGIQKQLGSILEISSIIETPAWGKEDSPDYLNVVLEITTSFLPLKLIQKILALEEELGRVRTEKWESRVIDIDILYYGNWHFATPNLNVPHPYISERRFVLEPLAQIAPDFVHPIIRKNNLTLLNELKNAEK